VKVHVPVHIDADWIIGDLSRTLPAPGKKVSRARAEYIKPKNLSIRQFIARAEKLKKL
jgi:hypothetical protein